MLMPTRLLSLCAAVLLWPALAAAQVGYRPGSSPFRDIPKGHTLTLGAALFGGGGGDLGVGPRDGPVYGARYDIRSVNFFQVGVQIARADLERLVIDPFIRVADRVTGPVSQSVTFAELDLQFNVTGGKTWNRLAPFVGVGGGFAFGEGLDGDTTRYDFGNKVFIAPHIGTRLFFAERLHLRAEARGVFWRLKYPDEFSQEPPLEPGVPPDDSNAVIPPGGRLEEWTLSSWLGLGLGYSF